MNKESEMKNNLHDLCALILMEESAPDSLINPDNEESKNYLSAIKWKKERLVGKIKYDAPIVMQNQVDKRRAEYEQSLLES